MTVTILLLILGFVILVKGADWLVNGSVSAPINYKSSFNIDKSILIGSSVLLFAFMICNPVIWICRVYHLSSVVGGGKNGDP